MTIYYAHFVGIYNTLQEQRDLDLIHTLFPNQQIINPNNKLADLNYKKDGMSYFERVISECDILIFRGCVNGKISSGVWKEINRAKELNIPIIEIPSFIDREMNVENTREMLKEMGVR